MVEVTRKKPKQPKDLIQITVDEETASVLRSLVGAVTGTGTARKIANTVWDALEAADVLSAPIGTYFVGTIQSRSDR